MWIGGRKILNLLQMECIAVKIKGMLYRIIECSFIDFNIRINLITILEGCEEEVFHEQLWSETSLGFAASSPCPCVEFLGSLAGQVLRYCIGTFSQGAFWSNDLDYSQCAALNSQITGRLCDVASVSCCYIVCGVLGIN